MFQRLVQEHQQLRGVTVGTLVATRVLLVLVLCGHPADRRLVPLERLRRRRQTPRDPVDLRGEVLQLLPVLRIRTTTSGVRVRRLQLVVLRRVEEREQLGPVEQPGRLGVDRREHVMQRRGLHDRGEEPHHLHAAIVQGVQVVQRFQELGVELLRAHHIAHIRVVQPQRLPLRQNPPVLVLVELGIRLRLQRLAHLHSPLRQFREHVELRQAAVHIVVHQDVLEEPGHRGRTVAQLEDELP